MFELVFQLCFLLLEKSDLPALVTAAFLTGVEDEGDGNGLVRFNGVEHAIGAGEENESLDILMGLTDPEFAEVSQLEGVTENESQDFAAEKSHVFVEQESAACITE